MADKLVDFMIQLAKDDDLKQSYIGDANKTMEKYGVSDEDRKLMLSKDYDKIQKRIGGNYKISHNTVTTAAKLKP
ncbi:hypothetical protein [Aliikangiella sp. G2MR2-5]|uniref:hypothetical protein n=1 Tax=Aliikangiella sp. G2MR2-5 TaxID=2788943 RepID=UPI0018A9185C|nr:hypothetical protein [Aliikangiella sp. G2MR2-5]